jgi:acyl-CoA synthetase (AMP-forming)/AMP-acid ligase II
MADRLDDLILTACARFPERLAVDDGQDQLTYRNLAGEVLSTTRALSAAGHRAGEPILVAVDNRSGDLVAQLATWSAGGTAIPVHRSTPAQVLLTTARRVGAQLILGDPRHHPAAWSEVAAGTGESWVHAVATTPSPVPAELDRDQALVIFTSGSTGQPKGVVLSHRIFHDKLHAIAKVLPFADGDTAVQVLHLNFSFGQWTSLLTLATGGTLRLVPRFTVDGVLGLLANGPVQRIAVVPSMLRQIATVLERARAWPDKLTAVGSPATWIAGGEPLTAGLGRRLRRILPASGIADVFGLSESATSDFILTPDRYDDEAGTIGRPSPGVEFRVEPLPDGGPVGAGELWLRTRYLMTGYLDDPAATAATMTGEWLRTGDLVRHRPDGLVELIGRAKQLIVRGGAKISPLEVEAAYTAHPDCVGCVAVGIPDEELGQRVHLLFVARDGSRPDEASLREYGRELLDRYKVPERVHFVDALPLGRTGKLDRGAAESLLA